MLPMHLLLGFFLPVPLLWSRRNAALVPIAALAVASCAAWGVVISLSDDADGSAFVSGFALAAANVMVGFAVGLAVFGATRAMAAGAEAFSRRRGERARRRPPSGRAS